MPNKNNLVPLLPYMLYEVRNNEYMMNMDIDALQQQLVIMNFLYITRINIDHVRINLYVTITKTIIISLSSTYTFNYLLI